MSDFLLIVILVVVGAGLALLVFRRKPATTVQTRASTAAPSRESMLQLVIPATGACCAAARRIETQRFYKQQAPALPLPDCSMKPGCHCRFQPVPDRRIGDRRMGNEKRDTIRYEENPRREGRGRRGVDKLFDHEKD